MKAIQPQQLRTMFAISRSIGMDNDELHALVQGQTCKDSLKELTDGEAVAVIAELKHRQQLAGVAPPPPKRRAKPAPEKPGGVTAAQQGKIWALIGQLEKFDTKPQPGGHRERLCGVIKRELHMDAAPSNPFQWLTMQQGGQLIDVLKRYAEHTELKALRERRVDYG